MPLGHQSLVAIRRQEIQRRYQLCRSHLLAADNAETRGLIARARQLRVYAEVHWIAAEHEQELLNLMIEEEVPTVFRQVSMFEERQAA
jgi:hypothetical protein